MTDAEMVGQLAKQVAELQIKLKRCTDVLEWLAAFSKERTVVSMSIQTLDELRRQ